MGPLFFFLLNLEQRNPYLIQICGFNLKVKSNKGMWLKNVRHKSLKKWLIAQNQRCQTKGEIQK